jgi:Fe-S-cluster containining protein
MENNRKNIENAFYADGFRLGMRVCDAGFNEDELFAALEEMYASVDSIIEMLTGFAAKQNQPVHCRKGCEWCCHQPVFALQYELDYLNHFVNINFDERQKSALKSKAESKRNALGFKAEKELLNAKHPCPLLENGVCTAYHARPMACRIYLSTNVDSCLTFFKQPEKAESIPALIDLPLRAGRMMNEGFKAALKNHGFTAKEYRIEEKLLE